MYAGYLVGNTQISAAAAMALSLGIAIQNFPEGAIISMPLRAEGTGKPKAFLGGVLSGIVEPIGAILTILAAGLIVPALPYLLSFAAGAMLYVVVEELIPEMSQGEHSDVGTIFFAVGFSVMMMLDVAMADTFTDRADGFMSVWYENDRKDSEKYTIETGVGTDESI